MSGLFAHKKEDNDDDDGTRYVSLNESSPTHNANSMRIYTMFPQMPSPMPLPPTSVAELEDEIVTRPARMAQTPHFDEYGCVEKEQRRAGASNDPKPTFISGFIVRQLVREGVIPMQ